jgi:hypothetical protein
MVEGLNEFRSDPDAITVPNQVNSKRAVEPAAPQVDDSKSTNAASIYGKKYV